MLKSHITKFLSTEKIIYSLKFRKKSLIALKVAKRKKKRKNTINI